MNTGGIVCGLSYPCCRAKSGFCSRVCTQSCSWDFHFWKALPWVCPGAVSAWPASSLFFSVHVAGVVWRLCRCLYPIWTSQAPLETIQKSPGNGKAPPGAADLPRGQFDVALFGELDRCRGRPMAVWWRLLVKHMTSILLLGKTWLLASL